MGKSHRELLLLDMIIVWYCKYTHRSGDTLEYRGEPGDDKANSAISGS